MSQLPHLLGVFRERAHSPGRETDDEQILVRVAERLAETGAAVDLIDPEELGPRVREFEPSLVFYMCEQAPVLEVLEGLAARGTRLVNRLAGVRNTFRHRMTPRLRRLGEAFPASRIVSAEEDPGEVRGLWVKRGDFHQTQAGDVVFARDRNEARRALAALGDRGVATAVLQEHVEGDIVKFYGVGTEGDDWFHAFYHRDQELRGTPYDPGALRALARRAAGLLELEVFGGDVIVRPDGGLAVIDVNAWPSYALVREEAAGRIAKHIERRLAEDVVPARRGGMQ